MIQSNKPTPTHTLYPSPQKPLDQNNSTDQNHNQKPGESAQNRKWKRMALKTLKLEGKSVMMGKRVTKDAGITSRSDDSAKKLKYGIENATLTTAEADVQPRRSS